MAVTHLGAGDIAVTTASSASATPAGSPTSGAVVGIITWNGTATLSTVKMGSSGPGMSLATGSNGSIGTGTLKKNAATYVYPCGSSPAGVYVTLSGTSNIHISAQTKDGVDQTTPASGGFYATGTDPFSVGNAPNTLAITKSSIAATTTDDQVVYGGWCQCNAIRTMLASSSSTADAEISDRQLSSIAAAGYYDQADTSSETATITFSTQQYYSTSLGWYGSALEGIITGCVIEAAGGGVSGAVTGTATASITEADIVTGGKTIILTLTGDTWIAAGTGPIGTTANTQAIIDGIDSAQSEGTGWDAVVKAGLVPASDVVRTSNTVCTITLPAFGSYNITAQETITVTIPAEALTGASPISATPTFTVSTVSAGNPYYYYAQLQ